MNPWIGVSLVGVVGWFLLAKPSRELIKGKAYLAVFEAPPALSAMATTEQISAIMPPGAQVTMAHDAEKTRLAVKFVAPTNGTMTDVDTPFGKAKVVEFRELA